MTSYRKHFPLDNRNKNRNLDQPTPPSLNDAADRRPPNEGITGNPATEGSAGEWTSSQLASKLPKIVPFNSIARCGEEVWIENDGQIYRLRKTKQGKLILTK